jgi:hypothetical protein
MKTLMLGCAAGDGQLDHGPEQRLEDVAILAGRIRELAKGLGASLIVLKEFSDSYRDTLAPFSESGLYADSELRWNHLIFAMPTSTTS